MKRILLILTLMCVINNASAQDSLRVWMQESNRALQKQDFDEALNIYRKIMETADSIPAHIFYNAAILSIEQEFPEDAVEYLNSVINKYPNWYVNLEYDTKIIKLKDHSLYNKITDSINNRRIRIESKYDLPLRNKLIEIQKNDQAIRQEYMKATREYGYQHPLTDSLRKEMNRVDMDNLNILEESIEKDGWATADKVGNATITYFLVLQHSSLNVRKKYLEQIRQAAQRGDIQLSNLARFEDRICVEEGRPQIYGTSVSLGDGGAKVHPITDPDNVDQRRAKVGLGPLADDLKIQYNIIWP